MRHFAIQDRLSERHWPAFQRLLLKRSLTIEGARAWLAKRGCLVGKTAVANYIKSHREEPTQRMRQELLGAASDAELRVEIGKTAAKLSGWHLAKLVVVAGYIMSSQGVNGSQAGFTGKKTTTI